jgi:hypothetical protein
MVDDEMMMIMIPMKQAFKIKLMWFENSRLRFGVNRGKLPFSEVFRSHVC